MRALNKTRAVRITADLGHVSRSGARRTMTATVRNRRAAVASMVRLSLLDAQNGRRVLPTLYSDNYLWLLPGESRTVTLSWPADALHSGRPALRTEAYNSARTLTRA
ncbi:glycosyl hydrolase [Streptomyces sp. L-9-10]|nr:glycosyl hydrolase [Streptomyces sp. L-9-10]